MFIYCAIKETIFVLDKLSKLLNENTSRLRSESCFKIEKYLVFEVFWNFCTRNSAIAKKLLKIQFIFMYCKTLRDKINYYFL